MRFTTDLIVAAGKLKSLGLDWQPAVGHYIYDGTHVLQPTSPFQDHVYYLLKYDCFLKAVGGEQRFKQLMTWLPTWHDARGILKSLGVSDADVQDELNRRNSLVNDNELLTLYEMIELKLAQGG